MNSGDACTDLAFHQNVQAPSPSWLWWLQPPLVRSTDHKPVGGGARRQAGGVGGGGGGGRAAVCTPEITAARRPGSGPAGPRRRPRRCRPPLPPLPASLYRTQTTFDDATFEVACAQIDLPRWGRLAPKSSATATRSTSSFYPVPFIVIVIINIFNVA